MLTISAAVIEQLRDNKEAVAIWQQLWARYEAGGIEAAQGYLDELLELPEDDEDE